MEETCIINCEIVENSPGTKNSSDSCSCDEGFEWVEDLSQCQRSICVNDPNSNGTHVWDSCRCDHAYFWNVVTNSCSLICLGVEHSLLEEDGLGGCLC